ncbi:hypothetical protein B0I35DRAFT_408783 [Stachybotrys elegans]|uniref:CBF1-interacting co-repressor CIR N-terminal domain-containing protein n=1 Tax=Stachybotrys elegans TaxID=80388 RepID=A0A8K0WSP4_9HYPO|nr:hypothetical protein B0I35DRAFT_408783 [Stachybotrys elegans]
MPLHLLGKKSWNVYNADNIARVRRDEAAAKAAEEAEEQRMQEVDAQRRLAILRGETPPPLPESDEADAGRASKSTERSDAHTGSTRRRRKRPGEDDTDFELRLAVERSDMAVVALESTRKPTSSAPITDHAGHIDLFGDERTRAHAEKNDEAEKEAKKKRREYEDQYTMRFSNAAGKDGLNKPWYSQTEQAAIDLLPKDVWGNEDPRRKERDSQRIAENDPLAMMKKGASRVRELKQERKKHQQERDEELRQLKKDNDRRDRRRKREERGSAEDSRHGESSRSRHRSREGRDDHYRDRDSRSRHGEERRRDRSRSPNHRRHRRRHDD